MDKFKQISYAFQQCKNFEHRLKFDKVTDSYKVGTFLRHSVETVSIAEPLQNRQHAQNP